MRGLHKNSIHRKHVKEGDNSDDLQGQLELITGESSGHRADINAAIARGRSVKVKLYK